MSTAPVPTAAQVFQALTCPNKRAATPADQEALETAVRNHVPHAGRQLALWSWGSGAPVWLLHGWESRAAHMAGFVAPLVQAGWRVLALDAPAHGDSGGDWSDAVDYGRSLLSLADAMGAPVATIGHSVGSAASLYAFSHGLQVCASVHLAGPTSMERALRRGAAAAGLDDEAIEEVLRRMTARIGVPLAVMDLEQYASGLIHRALILHDPDDPEVPFAESVALSDAWPESVLQALPGVGHRRVLRAPAVLNAVVEFLADVGVQHTVVPHTGISPPRCAW